MEKFQDCRVFSVFIRPLSSHAKKLKLYKLVWAKPVSLQDCTGTGFIMFNDVEANT